MSAPDRTPRRRQADRTAESSRRLALAAIELIAERGYDGTTAAAIGVRAGYSRELVRNRFGSKEALIERILREGFEDRAADVPPGLNGLERVLAPIDAVRELAETDTTLLRAAFVLSFAAAGGAAPIRPHVTAWFARIEASLAEAIAAGQGDGSVRRTIDPAAAAAEIAATAAGTAYSWTLDPGRVDLAARLVAWKTRLAAELAR